MKRTELVSLRRTKVTPDVASSLQEAEKKAAASGHVLTVGGPSDLSWEGVKKDPGPTGCPPAISMRCTGRELQIKLQIRGSKAVGMSQSDVEALWGLMVPLGWTPWCRYPIVGPGSDVFHYYGPWRPLYDSLLGEGRGELAWPSLCAAAQTDVGTWGGDRLVERSVQAQAHRLGQPVGPVDGIIGPRTQGALRALGVVGEGLTLEKAVTALACVEDAPKRPTGRRRGYLSIEGDHEVFGSGGVALVRNRQGCAVSIDGPGRITIEVR